MKLMFWLLLFLFVFPGSSSAWWIVQNFSTGGGGEITYPTPYAEYSFESGALEDDNKGMVDFYACTGVTASTTHVEGSYSALFSRADDTDKCYQSDANLPSTFPGKAGQSNDDLTMCGWINLNSSPDTNNEDMFVGGKYDSTGLRSYRGIISQTNDNPSFRTGYNSGGSANSAVVHGTTLTTGDWYYICYSLKNGVDASVYLFDDACATVGTDIVDETIANAMSSASAEFTIGQQGDNTNEFDGFIDLMPIWNEVLTKTQCQAACNQETSGGSSEYKYYGYPQSDGVPNTPIGDWYDYGTGGNVDRVYVRRETASGSCTSPAINIYQRWNTSNDNKFVVFYNGTTLVGKTDISSYTTDGVWTGFITLTAESGETTDIADLDVLNFGLGIDEAVNAGGSYLATDTGDTTSVVDYDTVDWATSPPATAVWDGPSSYNGLGVILRCVN